MYDRVKMTTRRRSRAGAVLIATVALLALTLSACGGSDDDAPSPSKASADSGSAENSSGANLPEGFPENVPLPEHNEIKTASALTEDSWRLMLLVDPDAEGIIEQYAQQLTDAGFEVSTDSSMVSGNNDSLSIDAVIRPPTITFQVIKRN